MLSFQVDSLNVSREMLTTYGELLRNQHSLSYPFVFVVLHEVKNDQLD